MPLKINPVSGQLDLVPDISVPADVDQGGTGRSTLTDGAVLVGNGTSAITMIGPLTDGQLLIGDTAGVDPVAATLTGGVGITVTNAAGSITIDATTGGFSWSEVTGTSQSVAVDTGYISNNAGLVTFTLPSTGSLGEGFQIVGKGAGLFAIAQNAGQTIHITSSSTTTGVGGSLTAIEQFASIELICTTANTDWTVVDSMGNFTVV